MAAPRMDEAHDFVPSSSVLPSVLLALSILVAPRVREIGFGLGACYARRAPRFCGDTHLKSSVSYPRDPG